MTIKKKLMKLLKKILLTLLIILSVFMVLFAFEVLPFFFIRFDTDEIDESKTITDRLGDEFKIKIKGENRGTLTQPSWHYTEISVKYKGVTIVSLGSKESEYEGNYNRVELLREYHDGNTHAYEFPFAIVYSLNDKKTFSFVCDKDYQYYCDTHPKFREIYHLLYSYPPA